MLTAKRLSEVTGVPYPTIRRWATTGKLDAFIVTHNPDRTFGDEAVEFVKANHRPQFAPKTKWRHDCRAVPCTDADVLTPNARGADSDSEQSVPTAEPAADDPESITLEQRAARIRQLQTDVQRGIIEIGRELIAAKAQVGHGHWAQWLQDNFQWRERTARNFMAVAERFGNRQTFADLNSSTLIQMLALPAGDEQKFIDEQAANGRPVNKQSARQMKANVADFKRRHAPRRPRPPTPSLMPMSPTPIRTSSPRRIRRPPTPPR